MKAAAAASATLLASSIHPHSGFVRYTASARPAEAVDRRSIFQKKAPPPSALASYHSGAMPHDVGNSVDDDSAAHDGTATVAAAAEAAAATTTTTVDRASSTPDKVGAATANANDVSSSNAASSFAVAQPSKRLLLSRSTALTNDERGETRNGAEKEENEESAANSTTRGTSESSADQQQQDDLIAERKTSIGRSAPPTPSDERGGQNAHSRGTRAGKLDNRTSPFTGNVVEYSRKGHAKDETHASSTSSNDVQPTLRAFSPYPSYTYHVGRRRSQSQSRVLHSAPRHPQEQQRLVNEERTAESPSSSSAFDVTSRSTSDEGKAVREGGSRSGRRVHDGESESHLSPVSQNFRRTASPSRHRSLSSTRERIEGSESSSQRSSTQSPPWIRPMSSSNNLSTVTSMAEDSPAQLASVGAEGVGADYLTPSGTPIGGGASGASGSAAATHEAAKTTGEDPRTLVRHPSIPTLTSEPTPISPLAVRQQPQPITAFAGPPPPPIRSAVHSPVRSLSSQDHDHLESLHDAARALASYAIRIGQSGVAPLQSEWESVSVTMRTLVREMDILHTRWSARSMPRQITSYRSYIAEHQSDETSRKRDASGAILSSPKLTQPLSSAAAAAAAAVGHKLPPFGSSAHDSRSASVPFEQYPAPRPGSTNSHLPPPTLPPLVPPHFAGHASHASPPAWEGEGKSPLSSGLPLSSQHHPPPTWRGAPSDVVVAHSPPPSSFRPSHNRSISWQQHQRAMINEREREAGVPVAALERTAAQPSDLTYDRYRSRVNMQSSGHPYGATERPPPPSTTYYVPPEDRWAREHEHASRMASYDRRRASVGGGVRETSLPSSEQMPPGYAQQQQYAAPYPPPERSTSRPAATATTATTFEPYPYPNRSPSRPFSVASTSHSISPVGFAHQQHRHRFEGPAPASTMIGPGYAEAYETMDESGSGEGGLHGGGGHASGVRPTKYRKRSRAPGPGRCISCGASDTPEWRRGPNGARTLCNACGLHYSKLVRRKRTDEGNEAAEVTIEELRASLKLPP